MRSPAKVRWSNMLQFVSQYAFRLCGSAKLIVTYIQIYILRVTGWESYESATHLIEFVSA